MEQKLTAKERVEQEQYDLVEKASKLMTFLFSEKGRTLDEQSRRLLERQFSVMMDYAHILNNRLIAWKD